jgi:UDP-N-acetylglucosamine:LPS N-acetylglucosamine transferase
VQSGAARMMQQEAAMPGPLTREILHLLAPSNRSAMQQALGAWHAPEASAQIAEKILHWNKIEGQASAVSTAKQQPVMN